MIMWVMSDRAIPRSYRMMEGFGVNSYRFINAQGKANLVKFHWKPLLGVHSLAWNESLKLGGYDPDYHRRDLWDAIESGAYPEWEFGIQVIPEEDQLKYDFDPLDATKIVPEEIIPVRRIGKLTLNRNPDNFFAETEQVAFDVGNLVPGIDFSNDPLLQGRAFSYVDTQLTRLGGPNFHEIPINRPVAPIHNNQRDGFHRQTINTGRVSYQPNSLGGGCPFQAGKTPPGFMSYAERIDGQKIRERSESFRDHFSQATLFWNSQSDAEKEHIVLAFRFELGKVETMHVRERMVDLLTNVDLDLANRVAEGIGVTVDANARGNGAALKRLQEGWETFGVTSVPGKPRRSSVERSDALSMANTIKDSVKTRKIAILAANGVDAAQLNGMKAALTEAGAVPELVSPMPLVKASDGSELKADKTLLTCGSVLYDAVYVPGGQMSASTLAADGDAVHFIDEAFKHCKAIAATGEGVDVLLASHIGPPSTNGKSPEQTLQALGSVIAEQNAGNVGAVARRFIEAVAKHRDWSRQASTGVATGMVPVPA
jgi:catalase